MILGRFLALLLCWKASKSSFSSIWGVIGIPSLSFFRGQNLALMQFDIEREPRVLDGFYRVDNNIENIARFIATAES